MKIDTLRRGQPIRVGSVFGKFLAVKVSPAGHEWIDYCDVEHKLRSVGVEHLAEVRALCGKCTSRFDRDERMRGCCADPRLEP